MESGKRIALARLTVSQYDAILNHCDSIIFVTDGTGQIIYANDAAERGLNCSFERMRQMDIYQFREEGYTSQSSSAEAIRTRKKALVVYKNNAGEEIAATSIPVFDGRGNITMVVTRSNEMEYILEWQRELDHYRALYERALTQGDSQAVRVVAESPQMKKILSTLQKYAQTDATILLTGESGTGKEVLANYIKQKSRRRGEAFLSINCAAIPNELIESELFGYERGAFTGANKEGKPGIFELADGGSIFLDEVGELPLLAQSKLLRVLESGEFRRVGAKKAQKTDVRIVAATNRDLQEMIAKKQFREDLYYRLCVIPVKIPPLRERVMDIEPIAVQFLDDFNRKYRTERIIPTEMMEHLLGYQWPGNIRELRNVMENYVITGEEPNWAEKRLSVNTHINEPFQTTDTKMSFAPLKEVMERAEKTHIIAILKACHGDVNEAARRLGIHRSVLYKKSISIGCGCAWERNKSDQVRCKWKRAAAGKVRYGRSGRRRIASGAILRRFFMLKRSTSPGESMGGFACRSAGTSAWEGCLKTKKYSCFRDQDSSI